MKENLIQKLDVLEGQLSIAKNESAEDTGKLARTKHILEKLSKSGQVISSVDKLEREIEDTKREIVSRKIYYALTVVKRYLKQFKKVEPLKIAKRQKSAETEAKKKTLEEEEQLVKELDIEKWSNDVVYRYLSKNIDISTALGENFEKKQLSSLESNIYGRIGKANPVREALAQLFASIEPYISSFISEGAPAVKPVKEVSVTDNNKPTPVDDFTKFEEKEEIKVPSHSTDPEYDEFFDQQIEIANSEDDDEEITTGAPPSLMQGFISGSDDDDEDAVAIDPQPIRRNRRGQRARQKIWEQKYGKKANHIIKQQREEENMAREKDLKRKRNQEKFARIKQQKQEFDSKPLHPSWEAKQKQKDKMGNVQFEGKKVKF